jgi:perosamine synthetase
MISGPTLASLPPFFSIGYREKLNVLQSMKRPLSGYIGGGTPRGGYWTDKLEEMWTHTFGCKYAIPCNSATSGLLAACMAIGIKRDDVVWTTPYSMSATTACALTLGATVKFIDIEPIFFAINPNMMPEGPPPRAIVVTNLFGHPAYLSELRRWCDARNVILIEDNAQAIFAKEGNRYAGTIGHMGVFSLNTHKHLQCGEGGIICTDDPDLSCRLRGTINHGELLGATPPIVGLNLRMTEPTAAIVCAQLGRADEIMEGRRSLALAITDMMHDIPWIDPPREGINCRHSYYVWAGKAHDANRRAKFCYELCLRSFPMKAGYTKILPDVFRIRDYDCPTARRIETNEIITFEVCAYDPKAHHLKRMREIVEYVAKSMNRREYYVLEKEKA